MKELKNTYRNDKYTKVFSMGEIEFGAEHLYRVCRVEDNQELAMIHFQNGAIKEYGVNGVCNEDLIRMVIDRLEGFQTTDFKCRENAIAITKLEEALLWLNKRTVARELRNVEGTHVV